MRYKTKSIKILQIGWKAKNFKFWTFAFFGLFRSSLSRKLEIDWANPSTYYWKLSTQSIQQQKKTIQWTLLPNLVSIGPLVSEKKLKMKLEAPRRLYSSPGYTCNNNMSIKLDNFGKKNNKCSPRHCRPLLLKNLGRGSSFNVNYQNCCKKNMSMILKI